MNPMPRNPIAGGSQKPRKFTRRQSDIRGPEEVHSELIYRQFALQAVDGGNLKFGHFEMMRLLVSRKRPFFCRCSLLPYFSAFR